MTDDEVIQQFEDAVKARAELAERRFAAELPVTEQDTIAVALAHPDIYELSVRVRSG